MVSGGSNGDGNFTRQKVVEATGADIGNGKRSVKSQLQIEQIFGEEVEGASSCMECSMCGDVGFPEQLLRCSLCHERQEHSYCSTSYRELGSNFASWVCDWCWPSLERDSSQSESDRQEAILFDKQESRRKLTGTSGVAPRTQNGLDLLLEVAWATADIQDLPTPAAKGMEKESVRRTAGPSTGSLKVESSPTKPSGSSKRRQGLGPDRWSTSQKRTCSRNYDTICARTGIQLERSNLAKGLGRRYRLLSSMLC